MSRLRHAATALGLLAPACAPATAHRGSAPGTTAAPAPQPGTDRRPDDVEPPPASSVPATTTTEEPTTTAYLVTIPTVPPTTTTVRPRPLPTTTLPENRYDELDDDEWAGRERILACIRSHEGAYGTETGNGFHGAYQFLQTTWDGAAARAGLPEWVGRRAGDAPAHVQDDVAWQLYTELGFGPWPPAMRYCRG